MKFAVCDDDKVFRNELKDNLIEYSDISKISIDIDGFSCAEDLLNSPCFYDIVFLDVEMEDLNGIDAGIKLKEKYPNTLIIVITAFDGYLDDAFRINAFRFLSKPLDRDRLYKAVDYALEKLRNETIIIYDSVTSQNIKINSRDIILIEIDRKKTKIVTINGIFLSNENISYWRNKLSDISFVNPHSSYIVNLNYSIQHTRKQLVLARKDINGNILDRYTVAVAPKKQAEIKKLFFDFVERR